MLVNVLEQFDYFFQNYKSNWNSGFKIYYQSENTSLEPILLFFYSYKAKQKIILKIYSRTQKKNWKSCLQQWISHVQYNWVVARNIINPMTVTIHSNKTCK